MESNALQRSNLLSSTKTRGEEEAETHVNITQMTSKDSYCMNLVRDPQPSRSIPTSTSEIDSPRTPLDVPNRFSMSSVNDQIRVGFERPQTDRRIGRTGEEVTWWSSWTGYWIEREGVDGSGMSDEFSSLRCRGMIEFLEISSLERQKVYLSAFSRVRERADDTYHRESYQLHHLSNPFSVVSTLSLSNSIIEYNSLQIQLP